MSDGPVILNVHLESVPGREEELAGELRALLAPTRKEPGCLIYEMHRDPEHRGKFMFYEKFENEAALALHTNSPYFKKFLSYRGANVDPVAAQTVTRWESLG